MSLSTDEIRAERERIDEILNREWPTRQPDHVIQAWKSERDQALYDLDLLNRGLYFPTRPVLEQCKHS